MLIQFCSSGDFNHDYIDRLRDDISAVSVFVSSCDCSVDASGRLYTCRMFLFDSQSDDCVRITVHCVYRAILLFYFDFRDFRKYFFDVIMPFFDSNVASSRDDVTKIVDLILYYISALGVPIQLAEMQVAVMDFKYRHGLQSPKLQLL